MDRKKQFYGMPAANLQNLTVRMRNLIEFYEMEKHGFGLTVADLIATSDEELLKIPNFGKKSVKTLREIIKKQAAMAGVRLVDFQDVKPVLRKAIMDGIQAVGEDKITNEILLLIDEVKEDLEVRDQLRAVIEAINPSETPFVRKRVTSSLYDWSVS